MVELISGLLEALEYLFRGFCGLRYIFSKHYRQQAHKRWRNSWYEAFAEIVMSVAGMVLLGMIVWWGVNEVLKGY